MEQHLEALDLDVERHVDESAGPARDRFGRWMEEPRVHGVRDDPKAGAVHSVMEVLNHPQLNHRMEVRGGVLAGRCAELLQSFFRDRREGSR